MSLEGAQRRGRPPDLSKEHLQASGARKLQPLNYIPKKPKIKPNKRREADELSSLLKCLQTPLAQCRKSSDVTKPGSCQNVAQWPKAPSAGQNLQHQLTEAGKLEKFSLQYQTQRQFSTHANHKLFAQVLQALVKTRLCSSSWTDSATPENVLHVVVCLRILLRDAAYQKEFSSLGGVKVLAQHLQRVTDSYLTYGPGPHTVDILKEITNIFQKLSAQVEQRQWLVACGVHKALVLLMSASDVIVLHCTLHALISLAQSAEPRSLIAELNSIEVLLRILQDYDMLSKKLAANLLRLLCADSQAVEMIKVYDGIPLMLSLLHSDSVTLLWNIVWCLVQLASDVDASNDIRQMGGIPLLLSLLHERKFVCDRTAANTAMNTPLKSPAVIAEEDMWGAMMREYEIGAASVPDLTSTGQGEKQTAALLDYQVSLKSAVCACLSELMTNDTNAQHVITANGIFLISLLMLPQQGVAAGHGATLQATAFRALRFLFSLERNRRLFKRLFPADLFECFIDIGHYNREIGAYKCLVQKLLGYSDEILDEIRENILATNQNKPPSHFIGDYAVLDLLGSGGFGSVYRVKKKTGQSYLAMKEINTLNPTLGKSAKERDTSVGEMMNELSIIKEQLKHPNVVRYYKTFVQQDKLYIVMELIEGAPIGEHFNSLKEKGERFSEDRIWHIFLQMVLALRYLHKEKGIVHRDLTPNNIMLGEGDKVTITDFGLAKQKQNDASKMTSVVGTILYSCPEIVKNEPYGEKADVWAIGCVLYQMCTLNPPFYSNNMLSLATKIVEADYEPVPEGIYSDKVVSTIRQCITADPCARPDIVGVASHITDLILVHMDNMRRDCGNLEKKLDRERKRTQKHYYEANQNMHNYHRLFLVSQERYDRLVNLAGSGGAASLKDETELGESVFSECEGSGVMTIDKQRRSSDAVGQSSEAEDSTVIDNGWVSDDEMGCSSGSESRESSAGPAGRNLPRESAVLPRPPGHGTPRARRKPRSVDYFNALTLDIPTKMSRDSGMSSGDPSPNNSSPPGGMHESRAALLEGRPKSFSCVQRSSSSTSLDSMLRKTSAGRQRPNSAGKATLTISPRKVRQISDPILQMLHILHKIIYISQLPPTLGHNPRRRIIERFKRVLFAPPSTSVNLKNELKKLLNGSRELIDVNFGPSSSPGGLMRQASREQEAARATGHPSGHAVYDTEAEDVGITYEQMQALIESVLVESGYYDMLPSNRHRHLPYASPGRLDTFLASHSNTGML